MNKSSSYRMEVRPRRSTLSPSPERKHSLWNRLKQRAPPREIIQAEEAILQPSSSLETDPSIPRVLPREHVARIQQVFGAHCDIYRDVLKVDPSANARQLRVAYFRAGRQVLVKDVSQMDTQHKMKFQAVSLSYEILSNEQWKRAYDQFGWAAVTDKKKSKTIMDLMNIKAPTTAEEDEEADEINDVPGASEANEPQGVLRTEDKPRSRSAGRIRWNEHVEELVYDQDPEERKLKKREKQKVVFDVEMLNETLKQLDEEHKTEEEKSFSSDFLDTLEDKVDGLSIDSLIKYATGRSSNTDSKASESAEAPSDEVSKTNANDTSRNTSDQAISSVLETTQSSDHATVEHSTASSVHSDKVLASLLMPPPKEITAKFGKKSKSEKTPIGNNNEDTELNTEEAQVSKKPSSRVRSDSGDLFEGVVEEKQNESVPETRQSSSYGAFNPFEIVPPEKETINSNFNFKERKKAKEGFKPGMSARPKSQRAKPSIPVYSAKPVAKIEPVKRPLSPPAVTIPVEAASTSISSFSNSSRNEISKTPSPLTMYEEESKEGDIRNTTIDSIAISRARSGVSAMTEPSTDDLYRTMDTTLTSGASLPDLPAEDDFITHLATYFSAVAADFTRLGENCGRTTAAYTDSCGKGFLPEQSVTEMLDTLNREMSRSSSMFSINRSNTF